MARAEQWKPKEGERVKVVGMPRYEGKYGTMIGKTGAGLYRVKMDQDGVTVGAETWNVRQLSELEMLAAEAPGDTSPLSLCLLDMRHRSESSRGVASTTWKEAAAMLQKAMKAQKVK
jgi:hypothetical protein